MWHEDLTWEPGQGRDQVPTCLFVLTARNLRGRVIAQQAELENAGKVDGCGQGFSS